MAEETNNQQVQNNNEPNQQAEMINEKPAEPTAKTYTEEELNQIVSDKLSEAEKLRKMNAEQKADYERKQLEQKLSEREKAVAERELRATAKETLASKGLPAELSDCLDYTDAEKCSKSIESVSKAFNTAVTNAVNARLKQNPPKSAGGNDTVKKDPFLEGLGL